MAYTVVNTEEPTSIIAGDSASWTITTENSDFYASAGFTLSYSLRGTTGSYNVTSTADGDKHLVEVLAATTSTWTEGTYYWDAYVTKTTERYTIKSGSLIILPDLASISLTGATSERYDGRSQAKRIIDAIDSTMEGNASDDAQTMQVLGSMIIKMSPKQMLEVRSYYNIIYRLEEARKNIDKGEYGNDTLYARFT